MAYKPNPAGPKNLREMFHWVYAELTRIASELGSGGGGSTDHDDLTNVTPDQHHNRSHNHIDPLDGILPTFAGAGTTGYVPDPITENGFFLRDDGAFIGVSTNGDRNVDGGFADSVYLPSQVIDGGSA